MTAPGKPHTPQSRARIAAARKRQMVTPAGRRMMAQALAAAKRVRELRERAALNPGETVSRQS